MAVRPVGASVHVGSGGAGMVNGRNIARHELIGLPVTVVRSPDPSIGGAEGMVADETRNSLVVKRRSNGKSIRIGKAGCVFRFLLPDGSSAEIDGNKIMFRPEDRVKRCK
jgi:RNase P/RNase MRP subunit p29